MHKLYEFTVYILEKSNIEEFKEIKDWFGFSSFCDISFVELLDTGLEI